MSAEQQEQCRRYHRKGCTDVRHERGEDRQHSPYDRVRDAEGEESNGGQCALDQGDYELAIYDPVHRASQTVHDSAFVAGRHGESIVQKSLKLIAVLHEIVSGEADNHKTEQKSGYMRDDARDATQRTTSNRGYLRAYVAGESSDITSELRRQIADEPVLAECEMSAGDAGVQAAYLGY